MLPKQSYVGLEDKTQKAFISNYLYTHEIGYCEINSKSSKSKIKQLPIIMSKVSGECQDNRLIINIIEKKIIYPEANEVYNEKEVSRYIKDKSMNLSHKTLAIGNSVFYEQMVDYKFISKFKDSNKISKMEKDFLWNVNADKNENIYLREPNESQLLFASNGDRNLSKQKLINIMKKQGVGLEDFKGSYDNKNISWIPIVQKENNQEFILSSEEKKKEFITKVKGFEKHFCSKILGVTENGDLIFKNEVTEEVFKKNVNDANLFQKMKLKDEDMFAIYDLSQIDGKSFANLDNYAWKINLKLVNTVETNIFMNFLKQLRMSSNFQLNFEKGTETSPINSDYLLESITDIEQKSKCLKIFVDKIEFRYAFKVSIVLFT